MNRKTVAVSVGGVPVANRGIKWHLGTYSQIQQSLIAIISKPFSSQESSIPFKQMVEFLKSGLAVRYIKQLVTAYTREGSFMDEFGRIPTCVSNSYPFTLLKAWTHPKLKPTASL